MKAQATLFILLILCSSAFACDSRSDVEFKPFINHSVKLSSGCNSIDVYIPNNLSNYELGSITYTFNDDGELSIPAMFIDASDLEEYTVKGFSLSQICTSANKFNKITVTATYYPPKGPNGEIAFCMATKKFKLSDLM